MANGRTDEQDTPIVAEASPSRIRVWGFFGETHLGQRSSTANKGRTHDRTRSVSQIQSNPLRSRGRPHMQQSPDDGTSERCEGKVKVDAALASDAEVPEAGEPDEVAFNHHLWRPRWALLCTLCRAIRGLMPRARQSRRQRRWSYLLSACSLSGRLRGRPRPVARAPGSACSVAISIMLSCRVIPPRHSHYAAGRRTILSRCANSSRRYGLVRIGTSAGTLWSPTSASLV